MKDNKMGLVQSSETKVRVKMWKSKKTWVCGAVLFAAMGAGLATTNVSAAEGDATTAPTAEAVKQELQNKLASTQAGYAKGLTGAELTADEAKYSNGHL